MYDDLVTCTRTGKIIGMLITAFAGITNVGLLPTVVAYTAIGWKEASENWHEQFEFCYQMAIVQGRVE